MWQLAYWSVNIHALLPQPTGFAASEYRETSGLEKVDPVGNALFLPPVVRNSSFASDKYVILVGKFGKHFISNKEFESKPDSNFQNSCINDVGKQ